MYYLRPMISLFEKFPTSKFFFDFPLYYIVASQPLNLNNTANLKQNPKIFCMFSQRPICSSFEKKRKTKNLVTLSLYMKEFGAVFVHFSFLVDGSYFFLPFIIIWIQNIYCLKHIHLKIMERRKRNGIILYRRIWTEWEESFAARTTFAACSLLKDSVSYRPVS